MSVNLKMNQYGMCISVNLTNSDGYEVNNTGLLKMLDDLLHKIELYEIVDIEIKKSAGPLGNDVSPSSWPFSDTGPVDTITITSLNPGDVSFTTMNDNIKL